MSARTSPRQQIPDIVARCIAKRAGLEGLPFSTLDLLYRGRLPVRSRAEIAMPPCATPRAQRVADAVRLPTRCKRSSSPSPPSQVPISSDFRAFAVTSGSISVVSAAKCILTGLSHGFLSGDWPSRLGSLDWRSASLGRNSVSLGSASTSLGSTSTSLVGSYSISLGSSVSTGGFGSLDSRPAPPHLPPQWSG